MTHLLIWLLTYPLIAAGDLYIRVQASKVDPGRLSKGHAVTYVVGTLIFLSLTLLQYV